MGKISFEEMNLKIAEFVRLKREFKDMSLYKLSKNCCIDYKVISKIEKGYKNCYDNNNFKISTIYKVLESLDSNYLEMFKYIYSNKK